MGARLSVRSSHAVAPQGGGLVLFGGYDGGKVLDDTWLLGGSTWVRVFPAQRPSARGEHAMAALDTKVVLFGGYANGPRGDTWEWDGTTWTQKSPAHAPPPRAGHVMAALGNKVILFGGAGAAGTLGDTWEWDGNDWTLRKPPLSPEPRRNAALAVTPQGLLLFGGADLGPQTLVYQDTWRWDGTTWAPVPTSPTPEARFGHALLPMGNQVLLFGGRNLTTGVHEPAWSWDGMRWSPRPTGLHPVPRYLPAAAPLGNAAVLVAGSALPYTNFMGDTWTWNGTAWTLRDRGEVLVLQLIGEGASAVTSGKDFSACLGSTFTVESWVWFPLFAGSAPVSHQIARVGGAVLFETSDSISPGFARVACSAPGPTPGKYVGPLLVLPQSSLQGGWHHLACTWGGPGTLPTIFIDGTPPAGATTMTTTPPSPLPTDLFVGYAGGSPQGKVMEQAEIRLSSSIRYGAAFTPPPFGARFEPDVQTCGLWHLGEGAGNSFFEAGLRWPLRATNGARGGPASEP